MAPYLRSVLIIEDEPDTAVSFKLLLETVGHAVWTARHGDAALKILHSEQIDVVLCDLGLPEGMSGLDLAAAIREDAELKSIPLVALTGYGQAHDHESTQAAGFSAHLTKPVALESIERAFRKIADSQAGNRRAGD